ncbi:MAG TPA: hypothetical protein VGO11_27855 [Chthoniobacteraceae bacterium]|jgi:hypothetical protein|nr:hypothetical protein [Chthoniobacteraceae bacterium]
MKPIAVLCLSLVLLPLAAPRIEAQAVDAARLRELRQKAQSSTITPQEQAELDAAMKARAAGRTPAAGSTPAPRPTTPGAAEERRAQYAERQEFSLQRMREMGKTALEAAVARKAGEGPKRDYFVNNETGDDQANGLTPERAVRSLRKGVSLLKPGDSLHLAVTSQPYRETLQLGDDFGGVPGKPIIIEGHGATIDGCDPLRLDGWTEAGAPGLYQSARFMAELEEFTDEAKLMRVFFMFDGVVQHMGRSSKGAKPRFKAPGELAAGEWTYAAAEKAFYVKVAGKLADAKVSAPYRRNGVAIRAPKVALTNVVIRDLIVSHVLNDGFNIHGTTKDLLLQNIAAYECGDDGISPHETCEVTIDGYWGVGNSTGMGNGYISVTNASNIRLEAIWGTNS